MPSKLRTAILALTTLTIAVSLAITGLTAHITHFIANLPAADRTTINVVVGVYDDADNFSREIRTIWYRPAAFTTADINALLSVSVLTIILSCLSLLMTLRTRDLSITRTLRLPVTPTLLTLHATTTLVLLAATATSFHLHTRPGFFWLSDPSSLVRDGAHQRYTSPSSSTTSSARSAPWTFETWNCALRPYVAGNGGRFSETVLGGACQQGQAARWAVLAAFVCAALALGCQVWAWRRHVRAVREEGGRAPSYAEAVAVAGRGKEKEVDLESQGEDDDEARSPVSPLSPAAGMGSMAEMTGAGRTGAELGWGSSRTELDAGTAAAEKAADEKV